MVQKRPFRDTHLLSKKRGPETPIFIVFFVCALFGPRCQKREILKSHPKKKKIFTDNWKAHFWVFFVFSCFFFFFFLFCFFVCFVLFLFFFGGFKGHVRWPEGPPHLALNPPYLFFVLFLFCFFFLFFCCFFGGFKGQVRWPEGPPHLALNPPYLFFFLFSFFVFFFFASFPFFVLNRKNLFFPLKRAFFGLFSMFPFLSPLTFFGLPLFHFLFLCLSVLLLSFFLPSCLSFLAFFFFLVFVSFFVLSSVLLFLEKNMKILNWNFFSSSKCSLFWVSCLVFSLKSLFLIFVFFFLFWVMFFVQHHCFWFQKNKFKNTFFQKRGVATKRVFFMNLCFAKCQKLSFFFGIFFCIVLVVFQKTL